MKHQSVRENRLVLEPFTMLCSSHLTRKYCNELYEYAVTVSVLKYHISNMLSTAHY